MKIANYTDSDNYPVLYIYLNKEEFETLGSPDKVAFKFYPAGPGRQVPMVKLMNWQDAKFITGLDLRPTSISPTTAGGEYQTRIPSSVHKQLNLVQEFGKWTINSRILSTTGNGLYNIVEIEVPAIQALQSFGKHRTRKPKKAKATRPKGAAARPAAPLRSVWAVMVDRQPTKSFYREKNNAETAAQIARGFFNANGPVRKVEVEEILFSDPDNLP